MTKRRNFFKHTNIRSYNGRRFKNPYFQKRSRSVWQLALGCSFILILVVIGLGYFFYGPYYKLENVEIIGLTTIPIDQVETATFDYLSHNKVQIVPKSHVWFIPQKQLSTYLMETFDLSKADIKQQHKTLTIQTEERILEFVWRTDRSFYFIDLDGNVMRELRDSERNTLLTRLHMELDPMEDESMREFAPLQPTMPIIEDKSRSEIRVNDNLMTSNMTLSILAFDTGLRAFAINPLIYEKENLTETWLTVVIDKPFKIFFDGAGDASSQLKALGISLNEYTEPITQYIDVRFENRAYVK